MCVILGKLAEQKKPSEKILRACWESNPHGGGLMWRESKDSQIEVYKGLMTISEFLKVAKNIPETAEAWYHARIVSRGSICQAQCHPFYLPDGAWYMHNGTFHIEPWQGMSDTQTVAEYINEKNDGNANAIIDALCRESGSKAVIMAPGEDTTLCGEWREYEGYKVSNTYFTPSLERSRVKAWAKSRTLCETCVNYELDCYGGLPEQYNNCVFYSKAE